jgi:site-specific DNA recombinase
MERVIREIETAESSLLETLRVAAYARVSSGKEAMHESLSNQVSHYSDYIQMQSGWEYAGTYSDEAYTGTKAARPGFQRLLGDCRAGLIDMIITKSVSRFARNTVTLLKVVRELKAKGIDVYFEKENIHSISGDGELMLTILASYAQEESRSVSENCKWRIRKQFEEGKPVSLRFIYGYSCDKGVLTVRPDEAEVVRMIFDDYLGGMGRNAIMKKLNAAGLKTQKGNLWSEGAVDRILRNEKYCGNSLMQKTYSENHITKRKRINHGELPMFFAEGTHESIITHEAFDRVQELLEQRARQYSNSHCAPQSYPFSGKLVCGVCGRHYRRKSLRGGQAYAWICSTFNTYGKAACASKQIPEPALQAVCAEALGVDFFEEKRFREQIDHIFVPEANRLAFVFSDGHKVETTWRDRSRSESWTDEMREKARIAQLRRCAR